MNGIKYQREVDWVNHKLYADAAARPPCDRSFDPCTLHGLTICGVRFSPKGRGNLRLRSVPGTDGTQHRHCELLQDFLVAPYMSQTPLRASACIVGLWQSATNVGEPECPARGGLLILEDSMRERALKIVLVLVGLLFTAALIPTYGGIRGADPNTGDTMQMAIYATLGVFLLLAVRRPVAYRSVIAFAAWSSVAHAITMGLLGFEMPPLKAGFVDGSVVLVVIGATLLALLPKRPIDDAS